MTTTTPTFRANEQAHTANLQEREKGQRDIVDGLRRSNEALTAEVHKQREEAYLDAERCDRYAARINELEQRAVKAEAERDAAHTMRDFQIDGRKEAEYERDTAVAENRRLLRLVEDADRALASIKSERSVALTVANKVADIVGFSKHMDDLPSAVRKAVEERDQLKARFDAAERSVIAMENRLLEIATRLRDSTNGPNNGPTSTEEYVDRMISERDQLKRDLSATEHSYRALVTCVHDLALRVVGHREQGCIDLLAEVEERLKAIESERDRLKAESEKSDRRWQHHVETWIARHEKAEAELARVRDGVERLAGEFGDGVAGDPLKASYVGLRLRQFLDGTGPSWDVKLAPTQPVSIADELDICPQCDEVHGG